MTLEALMDLPADDWEKLTDDQLLEMCKPFFNVTRPELAVKPYSGVRKVEAPQLTFKTRQNMAALTELGIDVSFMNKRRKR